MKKLMFLILFISQVSFAAKSDKEIYLLLKEVNYSFFQISQVVRNLSEAHLDRTLESKGDDFETCREIKEKITPFIAYLQSLNEGFKSKLIQTKGEVTPAEISKQFSRLHTLTQSSIDKCNSTEVLFSLQELRKEIMNAGFTLQRVEI